MEKYLMGIDAGNTSSKVVIFDLYGKMIATAATPSMHFKRRGEGFEEFDVTELWNLISVCIKEAVEKAAVAPEQIAGVGVTSFGNGVVFLDKEGYAIAPGCFSQDYRALKIFWLHIYYICCRPDSSIINQNINTSQILFYDIKDEIHT